MRITSKFLVFAAIFLIVACQSNTAHQPPEFYVTPDQEASLTVIVSQIQESVGKVPRMSLSEEIVSDILAGYDDDIRALLNQDQWNTYTEYQKPEWTSRIFREVMGIHRENAYSPGLTYRGERAISGWVREQ